MKNGLGCGCVLVTLLFTITNLDIVENTVFLLHLKAFRAFHPLMLVKLHVYLMLRSHKLWGAKQ
jgi:hypothetical protein